MSQGKSRITHAGPLEGGMGGIDGAFMEKHNLILALIVISEDDGSPKEGAIMLNPQFNLANAKTLAVVISELNRQAQDVFGRLDAENGVVH